MQLRLSLRSRTMVLPVLQSSPGRKVSILPRHTYYVRKKMPISLAAILLI